MKPKFTIIIPVYNEMKTVGSVVTAAATWPGAADVIVVDDASTDATPKILARVGKSVKIMTNNQNLGKSQSIARAIPFARGEFLIFMDADISGLTHADFESMTEPVKAEKIDMVIATIKAFRAGKMSLFNKISGIRVVRKKLLTDKISEFAVLGYGMEVYLNNLVPKTRIAEIELPYVFAVDKLAKWELDAAAASYGREFKEIARELTRQVKKKITVLGDSAA